MRNLTKTRMSPTQVLLLGFIAIILIGTMILKLPISNNGKYIKFIDAFFTATAALCVTGLTTKIPAEQFSTFGQVVIMCWIKLGGLRIYDICINYTNVYR